MIYKINGIFALFFLECEFPVSIPVNVVFDMSNQLLSARTTQPIYNTFITSQRHIRVDRFRPRDDTVPRNYIYHTILYTPQDVDNIFEKKKT